MKRWIRTELHGWRAWEITWLLFATAVIVIASVCLGDSALGIVCAITGIWNVVLTGKGKASNFLFGIINVVLYAYLSFQVGYYGEVMLNLLYYLPCSVVGLFLWSRHTDAENGEVTKKSMSALSMLVVGTLTAAAVAAYGFLLRQLGGQLPFTDSISTVLSLVAQILCLKRFAEQWLLWIVVDAVTIGMWGYTFVTEGEHIATLLMWIVYFVNAVIMYVKWRRDVKRCDTK